MTYQVVLTVLCLFSIGVCIFLQRDVMQLRRFLRKIHSELAAMQLELNDYRLKAERDADQRAQERKRSIR